MQHVPSIPAEHNALVAFPIVVVHKCYFLANMTVSPTVDSWLTSSIPMTMGYFDRTNTVNLQPNCIRLLDQIHYWHSLRCVVFVVVHSFAVPVSMDSLLHIPNCAALESAAKRSYCRCEHNDMDLYIRPPFLTHMNNRNLQPILTRDDFVRLYNAICDSKLRADVLYNSKSIHSDKNIHKIMYFSGKHD